MDHKILVVAAHPDDEILGVGGTILRHVSEGDSVHVMILAEGITSRGTKRDVSHDENELSRLHEVSRNVAEYMGVSKLILCGFPDNRMDGIDLLDVVKRIEREVYDFCPDIIYTHHVGDVNVDHQIAHKAVITACRPLPGMTVKQLLFFETLSSTEWQISMSGQHFFPNWYVDIGEYLEKKLTALHFYETEMRDYPHPRSYLGVSLLAKMRGMVVGIEAAEAFVLGRKVYK